MAVWDNRSAMHAGSPFDETERRLMHRVTFAGPDTIAGQAPDAPDSLDDTDAVDSFGGLV